MAETLFAFNERNYRQCQKAYRGDKNQEYYLGDYSINGGSIVEVRAERRVVGPCSIVRIIATSPQFFRRSWSHIREDATDVTVLWFVKRGILRVSHQAGNSIARAGDFAVTNSMTPFTIECEPDDESLHEVLHVVVPTHIFQRFIPQNVKVGFTVSAQGRAFRIAERLLTDVLDDGDTLAEPVEQLLVDSALSVLTDALQHCDKCILERQPLPEKRFQDVLRFIEVHLSDPKLNADMVAEACGISSRYLLRLFSQHGTSFSKLVWDRRLKAAHQWLSSTKPGEISIAEIAFRVGFKSPAHFSRLFKRVYKVGPREFRSARMSGRLHRRKTTRQQGVFSGFSETLQ